ncbi:MAG: hypothetical protein ABI193_04160 [Minicystis sp.]
MRRIVSLVLLAALLVLASLAGCSSTGDPSSGGGGDAGKLDAHTGTIIIGLTSDLRVGVDIDRVHVIMRVAGEVTRDEILGADMSKPLVLPTELPFENLAEGTQIDVALSAFRINETKKPLVERSVSSKILGGKKLLLRVQLDSRCAVAPGSSAPVCIAPLTCVAGLCAPIAVDARNLPAWVLGWEKASTDLCKPQGAGAPSVTVGEGQSDYLATMDNDVAQVEAGPQGGHHIWIAVRMKNLLQSGSITTITGHFEDPKLDAGPFQVIFTFDQDEGGYCKLYGLRFQLDQSTPIEPLLGKTVKVTVKVTDKDGTVGVGTRIFKLSDTFI